MKIGILSYGFNNIYSVYSCMYNMGFDPIIIEEFKNIKTLDKLIIPGIGNANTSIKLLKNNGFFDEIINFYNSEKPILGICLGMQIFAKNLYEGGVNQGLNILDADIVKIDLNLFNIGWKKVEIENNNYLKSGYFYFCHSYKVKFNSIMEENNCIGYAKEEMNIPSIIHKNNFLGCQFHPEKSHSYGKDLILNFLKKF